MAGTSLDMVEQQRIKQLLTRFEKRPIKRLGQNFLLNECIINCIVETVLSFPCQSVMEIGPGLGALTERLAKAPVDLSLVEIDKEYSQYWIKRGIKTFCMDALKFNWKENICKKTIVCGNLPYGISSRLLVDLSLSEALIPFLVFMFQKEVAQRITAPLGSSDYGFLSVISQNVFDIDKVIDAGPKDFFPHPQVGSRVLVFERKKEGGLSRENLRFLQMAFAQPRKKLQSNIKKWNPNMKWEKLFEEINISENVRPGQVSVQSYEILFEKVRRMERQ